MNLQLVSHPIYPSLRTILSTSTFFTANDNQRFRVIASVTHGPNRTWTYTYDSLGHILTAANPLGAVTAYAYNANSDTISTVTDALGHVSKITAYTAGGLPLSMTDPNGVQTTLAYDTRNRLVSRPVAGATSSFSYDAAGNLAALTLPDGSQLLYTYDTAHRVTQVKNNLGETINYTLDANDDITQQQISGSTITKTQTAAFDSLGRMLQQIGAYNETTAFAYDSNGNRTGTTNGNSGDTHLIQMTSYFAGRGFS